MAMIATSASLRYFGRKRRFSDRSAAFRGSRAPGHECTAPFTLRPSPGNKGIFPPSVQLFHVTKSTSRTSLQGRRRPESDERS